MKYKLVVIIFSVFTCFSFINAQEIKLNYQTVTSIAQLPLHCIQVEYPNKLNQVLTDSSYIDNPKKLHPIFYGCFDWHSSVHGHWLLAKALNLFPKSELASEVIQLFDEQFTSENVQAELNYFRPKLEQSFERTYGWAWLLKLQAELIVVSEKEKKDWSKNLQPLVDYIVEGYKKFLPKLVYPIRVGEHTNTAFGLSLALDYTRIAADTSFERLICNRARDYYLSDINCPLTWEPSGFDFISPCLQEAELMSKVLNESDFEKWMNMFLPELFSKKFTLEPGRVIDRTDGKLVHLDGLNFSRAWCFYALAKSLPKYANKFIAIGDEHLNASYQFVIGSDYMGSHWLASFLLHALEKKDYCKSENQ